MTRDSFENPGQVVPRVRTRSEWCWPLAVALIAAASGCAPAPQSPSGQPAAKPPAEATETRETAYAIWDDLELDRCASVWLIKRFVDPNAEFKIYPEGTLSVQGIPVDMPTSKYRRTQRQAVFEVLLDRHGLDDPALHKLARQVHAVEIDYWIALRDAEAQLLNERLLGVLEKASSPEDALQQSLQLFDEVLLQIRREQMQKSPSDPD